MAIKHLFTARCPNCHKGNIFRDGLYLGFSLGSMNENCPVCGYKFEKEPGYYWGAMFVSYGLALAEMVAAYFVCRLFGTNTFDWINLWVMCGVVLVLAPFNFKMARVMWLYLVG